MTESRPGVAQLNPAQREAVEHGDGPLLILAGAGSGKTRVITQRIASLIELGVDAERILAVSFTNKAANEMAERMVPLIGKRRAGRVRMSTFHSFGLSLLKEEADASGLDGRFVIFDQSDSLGVVKEILRERYRGGVSRRFDPMAVLARISNWKSAMVRSDAVADSECDYDGISREVYEEYEERMAAMRALDFDDLVCRPVHLLRSDETVRLRRQRAIEHLLVDEFQDTSEVQLELVKLLANDRRNVCVVGDDDQSIYSWRGANVGNILEFESHFPGAKVIKLETNYRSRAPILEVANAVIANSSARRHPKILRSARTGGDAVRVSTCESPRAEAVFVAKEIGQLNEEGTPYDRIAVLYRSNQQARLIEEELTERRIPYRLFGGQQFFDRKEVKDAAAYLRVVVNPYDEISLRRIINFPARGIGTRSVQRIEEFAKQHGKPFTRAAEQGQAIDGIPDIAKRSLGELSALFGRARARMKESGALHAAAVELIGSLDLREAFDDTAEGGNQGARRWQNVVALLGWIERYERNAPRTRKSLQDFLQRVTLQGDVKNDDDGPEVTLCTLHAAKGLEFPVVFLIGCVEGQLPHSRTTDPRAHEAVEVDLDEERRLFYVGITRAQDRLYLTASRQRMLRGKTVDVAPSRYMDDIPDEHVQQYEREEEKDLSFEELSALTKDLLKKHRGAATTAD
ncbi:MAG: UvrD-helicase domain-containing protein [bacterium]|nr:UvrD-helicase domain-containing protein [bacterium]